MAKSVYHFVSSFVISYMSPNGFGIRSSLDFVSVQLGTHHEKGTSMLL